MGSLTTKAAAGSFYIKNEYLDQSGRSNESDGSDFFRE
jgi:hypothetical protein